MSQGDTASREGEPGSADSAPHRARAKEAVGWERRRGTFTTRVLECSACKWDNHGENSTEKTGGKSGKAALGARKMNNLSPS